MFEPSNTPISQIESSPIVRVKSKQSPYSSIHLVLWSVLYQDGFSRRVPVEVQIRSPFEDVWAEVDHRLRYKMRYGDVETLGKEQSFYSFATAHLTNLKGQLNYCSNTADLIDRHVRELFGGASLASRVNLISQSQDINELNALGLASPLQRKLNACVSELRKMYIGLYEMRSTVPDELINAGIGVCRNEGSSRCPRLINI